MVTENIQIGENWIEHEVRKRDGDRKHTTRRNQIGYEDRKGNADTKLLVKELFWSVKVQL